MEPKTILTINSEKDHPVAFELDMDGIDTTSVSVRLCLALEREHTFLMMVCELVGESTYKTIVPAKSLPIGSHDCTLEVVTNEHYFIAMSGKVKVTGTPKVKAEVKEEDKEKPVSKPKAKVVSEPEEGKNENEEQLEMPVESSSVFMTLKSNPMLTTINETETSKNKEVKQILSELGMTSTPPTKKLKDYLKG